MIDSLKSNSSAYVGPNQTSKLATTVNNKTKSLPDNAKSDVKESDAQRVSTLARQLAESARRADERDKTLTRSELADKAKSIVNYIVGVSYFANKNLHDNEVPKTSDPELLARAKQATAFVNDASLGGYSVKNPFSGLSHEQLSNIVYDESGTYTVNERQAAWRESYDQEGAWREKFCAKSIDEYNRTGKLTNFFKECLEHFKNLPSIEQAQYPKEYASNLEHKIELDFNFRTHQTEGNDELPMSMIAFIFEHRPQETNSYKF